MIVRHHMLQGLDKALQHLNEIPETDDLIRRLEDEEGPTPELEKIMADTVVLLEDLDTHVRKAHIEVDAFLVESGVEEALSLAELVLDHERGLRSWDEVLRVARRLA